VPDSERCTRPRWVSLAQGTTRALAIIAAQAVSLAALIVAFFFSDSSVFCDSSCTPSQLTDNHRIFVTSIVLTVAAAVTACGLIFRNARVSLPGLALVVIAAGMGSLWILSS
jgi:hypothetical protein